MEEVNFSKVPNNPRSSTKFVVELLLRDICPLILRLRSKLTKFYDEDNSYITKIRDVFALCSSQIKKSVSSLLAVFKLEFQHKICLEECRQCNFERLSWCFKRLTSVEQYLERMSLSSSYMNESADDSMMATVMYFVNWIDHTFELLNKLADLIYKTDYKESESLYHSWKNDMVECVSGLHVSIDELLLSAMTLCRYSLPGDQLIVKARCQVVLRETKALLTEVIEGDLSSTVTATPDTLKLPIKPSNVNILIDVLKDVLYVLETNTNTALLALLIHCFSGHKSPVDILKDHFANNAKGCSCLVKSDHETTEDCPFVKDFDLYNERLLQIGSFAVSCSSDHRRILSLRSGLASLEALDPHLVPALMTSPNSHHAEVLMTSWRQEVCEIRDSVFLIVDPVAFAEKAKQMMHQRLLEVLSEDVFSNERVCSVVDVGCVLYEFFRVYQEYEPGALTHHDKLVPLLADLNKVQKECKIVSNLLSKTGDFLYNIRMPANKEVSFQQLLKRLKLLYTLVNRINCLLHPKETDDQLFEEEEPIINNATHTVCKNGTYVHTPKKAVNMSRSIFARTTNIRSSTRNFPLAKLTKHLRTNTVNELSFSVHLDNLFNLSETKEKRDCNETGFVNKQLVNVRENSVFYKFSPIKYRSSLRKAVLNKYCYMTYEDRPTHEVSEVSDRGSIMDEGTSLQITDVLNQLDDVTSMLSTTQTIQNTTRTVTHINQDLFSKGSDNKLTLNINNQNTTVSKHIWTIPVYANSVEITTEVPSYISNLTQPSDVNTLERISDLDLLESKLSNLKSQFETSL